MENPYLKVSCPRCSAPHTVYGKSTLKIKCEKCNRLLTKPTGGKTKIKANVRKVFTTQEK